MKWKPGRGVSGGKARKARTVPQLFKDQATQTRARRVENEQQAPSAKVLEDPTESGRLVWLGWDFKDHLVPTPWHGQRHLPQRRLLQAPTNPAWDTAGDGAPQDPEAQTRQAEVQTRTRHQPLLTSSHPHGPSAAALAWLQEEGWQGQMTRRRRKAVLEEGNIAGRSDL